MRILQNDFTEKKLQTSGMEENKFEGRLFLILFYKIQHICGSTSSHEPRAIGKPVDKDYCRENVTRSLLTCGLRMQVDIHYRN